MAGLFDDLIPQGRVPASIRNNNPGAQWPGPSASRFGSSDYEMLNDGQGNKIARFETPEAGAAAQFDLLNRKYTGMTVADAIRKWSGGNSSDAYAASVSKAMGINPNAILSPEILADPNRAIPFARAMARVEAGRDFPMSDEQWAQAHQMAFAGTQSQPAGVQAINKAMSGGQQTGMFDDLIPSDASQGAQQGQNGRLRIEIQKEVAPPVTSPEGFDQSFQPQQSTTDPGLSAGLVARAQAGSPQQDVGSAVIPPPENRPVPTALSASNEGILQGLTFGFGDELMAGALTPIEMAARAVRGEDWSPGAAYDAALARERGMLKEAKDQYPTATTVGDIAGSLASGLAMSGGGGGFLKATNPTTAGLIGRGAAEGAIYGGVRGAGEGEGTQNRMEQAAAGATIGGIAGAGIGALAARSSSNAAKKLIPSIEQLKAKGDAAYQAADAAGLALTPQSLTRLGTDIAKDLRSVGYSPRLHPRVAATLDELSSLPQQPTSLRDVDTIRKIANNARMSLDPSEQMIGSRMIDQIDNFLAGLKPQDVVSGNSGAAVKALTEARQYWAQYRRLDMNRPGFTGGHLV